MRRSIGFITVAMAGVIFGLVISASAQIKPGAGRVTIPESSKAKPNNGSIRFHTNILVLTPKSGKAEEITQYGFETPASLGCVYHLTPFKWGCNPNDPTLTNPTGGSNSIAIVDAYDDPNAQGDLEYFCETFGIPMPPSFTVVYASGTQPGTDPTGGWELEESLDIEWSHAMAPGANIYLVEAASENLGDLIPAVLVAGSLIQCGQPSSCPPNSNGTGEITMSWGTDEFSSPPEQLVDQIFFSTPGVVYFAASDDVPGVQYPCTSPNVVCAGGTTTARNPYTGNFQYEVSWAEGGGGTSSYESIPSYQSSIWPIRKLVGNARGVPDLSFDSNPDTGVWIYDSFGCSDVPACWDIVGGTSVASASLAGIVNSAGTFAPSSAAELTIIYDHLGDGADFNDITYGICGPYGGWLARPGWDFCTGVGSVRGLRGK